MKKVILLLSIFFGLALGIHAQSAYGYLGKRLYLSGDISASPAFLSKNEDGENAFRFNVNGMGSLNLVLNKRQVLGLSYRYYSNIAEGKRVPTRCNSRFHRRI